MKLFTNCFLALSMAVPSIALAESTISQPISRVSYAAQGDAFYVEAPAKWGAPSCPNATFILITSSTPNYKQLTAMILTAQAGGRTVTFAGSCYSNPDYFTANYIWIE